MVVVCVQAEWLAQLGFAPVPVVDPVLPKKSNDAAACLFNDSRNR